MCHPAKTPPRTKPAHSETSTYIPRAVLQFHLNPPSFHGFTAAPGVVLLCCPSSCVLLQPHLPYLAEHKVCVFASCVIDQFSAFSAFPAVSRGATLLLCRKARRFDHLRKLHNVVRCQRCAHFLPGEAADVHKGMCVLKPRTMTSRDRPKPRARPRPKK